MFASGAGLVSIVSLSSISFSSFFDFLLCWRSKGQIRDSSINMGYWGCWRQHLEMTHWGCQRRVHVGQGGEGVDCNFITNLFSFFFWFFMVLVEQGVNLIFFNEYGELELVETTFWTVPS